MTELLELKIKKLDNYVGGPSRSIGNAGYDLCAAEEHELLPGERFMFRTGIACSFSDKFYMRIAPRSGLALKYGIDVMAGVVDSVFRQEVKVILINLGQGPYVVNRGDRIAQMIPERIYEYNDFSFVEELAPTNRGSGFGSSGL